MNDPLLPHPRRPVVIADSKLSAGAVSARVQPDDPEALLRQYLRLIRRARSQERAHSIALRRVDIDTLADHLGLTDGEVLDRLAELMGVTQRQRSQMLAVLATGATLITIANSWAGTAAASDAAMSTDDSPVIVIADHLDDDGPSPAHTARVALSIEPGEPPRAAARMERHAPVLEAQYRRADSAVPQARVEHEPLVSEPPVGTDDHGNHVAVDRPPTPPTVTPTATPMTPPTESTPLDTGTDDHGNLVAVDEPPTPPDTGGDDHGLRVAVDEPPIPPDAGTDDHGNHVAVDEPPIPPGPPTPEPEHGDGG